MKEGGFQQLQVQLKRALTLSKESLRAQDYSSESSNISKKFIDQMLRLMKTFIFAAIIADQEPTGADDFLQLKRNASTISDKPKKVETKPDLDEAQFQQNDPSAQARASGPVHGPLPPANLQKAGGDSDEANIGEED